MNMKRPREVAAQIVKMPRQDRIEAIKRVDGDTMRSAVKMFVDDYEAKVEGWVRHVISGRSRIERGVRLNKVPRVMVEEVKALVEERFLKQRRSV